MTRLTATELERLRALLDASTPGSWNAKPARFKCETVVFTDDGKHVAYFGHDEEKELGEWDAELCATTRNMLPGILDHITSLEADLAARDEAIRVMREALAFLSSAGHLDRCARYVATGEQGECDCILGDISERSTAALAAADRALSWAK